MCYSFKQNNREQFRGFTPSINAVKLQNLLHLNSFVSHFLHWPCAVVVVLVIIVTAIVACGYCPPNNNSHCLQLKVLRVYVAGDLDCTIFVNILSSVNMKWFVVMSCALALYTGSASFCAVKYTQKSLKMFLWVLLLFILCDSWIVNEMNFVFFSLSCLSNMFWFVPHSIPN